MTRPTILGSLTVLAAIVSCVGAGAGVIDSPLPTFGDGAPAVLVTTAPAVKDNAIETVVVCTNVAPASIDVGVEFFDESGALRNTVAAGDGGVVGLGVGATATIASGATAVMHEDTVVTLNGGGTTVSRLRNGSLRVVASDPRVGCVVYAVDRLHAITDPASCPQCQPPAIAILPSAAVCSAATCDDGDACTIDACGAAGTCTHTPAANAMACDDGDLCTTGDACLAGVCHGVAVTCAGDNPCLIDRQCDAATGQCVAATPRSTCVPGGGDLASDCALEWVVENPGNPGGINRTTQQCKQGDGRCDFDSSVKSCTFMVRACVATHDANLPSCTPAPVSTLTLAKPRATGGVGDLFTALAALSSSTRAGKGGKRITFSPALATTDACTPPARIAVRFGRATTLKTKTTGAGGTDKDRLQLRCVRRLSGAG